MSPLTSKTKNVPSTLKVCSANVNTIKSRIPIITARLLAENIDVLLCQETKLSKSVIDATISIRGYTTFRKDRTKNGGGGVLIYIKNEYCPSLKILRIPEAFECVACEITLNGVTTLIASVYKPPQQDPESFVEALVECVSLATPHTSSLIIGGDTNLDLYDPKKSIIIATLCRQLNVTQCIPLTRPTHKKSHLDHLFVRNLKIVNASTAAPVEKHHVMVTASLSYGETRKKLASISKPFIWRNWEKTNWSMLESNIHSRNIIEQVENTDDPNVAWSFIKSAIIDAVDEVVPSKWLNPKSDQPKWFNREIRQAILSRNKVWRKLQKTPATHINRPTLIKEHRLLSKTLHKLLNQSQRKVFDAAFASDQKPRVMWSTIKSLTQTRQNKVAELTDDEGKVARSDDEKAAALMNQYSSICTTSQAIYDELPVPSDSLPICLPIDMYDQLSLINPSKSAGPDNIPGKVLKNCRSALAAPLARLANLSVEYGQPEEWLRGHIIPIAKKAGANHPKDYRPITMLCISAKCYEKWILSLVEKMVDSKLPVSQFGFRRQMGTQETLLTVENKIHQGFAQCIDTKQPTAVHLIALDLAKAFDKVDHCKLLLLLRDKFLFPPWAMRCFKDHICNRTVAVRNGSALSNYTKLSSGVPQGAPSSAILFIASIIEVGEVNLSENAEIVLYADDCLYLKPGNSVETASQIEDDLSKIQKAMNKCGQQLNHLKTEAMLSSIAPTPPSPIDIKLGDTKITYGTSMRYLGMIFDQRLTFKEHIRVKVCRARQLLGATAGALCKYGHAHMIGRLWNSVVKPGVTYGWFLSQGKTAEGDNRMHRLQLMAARYSLNYYEDDDTLLTRLKWQTISSEAYTQRIRMAYNIVHGHTRLLSPVFEIFTPPESRTRSRLHHSQLKCQISYKKVACQKSSFSRIAEEWNKLPASKIDLTKSKFKTLSRNPNNLQV